jgi:hypothetical protein
MSTFEYLVEDVTHELRCTTKDDENKYFYQVNLHLKSVTDGTVKVIYVETPDDKEEDEPFPCEVSYLYSLRNKILWGKDRCLMLDDTKFGGLHSSQLFLAEGWLEQIKGLLSNEWADIHTNKEILTPSEIAIIHQPGFKVDTLSDGPDDDTPYLSLLTGNTAYIGMSDAYLSQILLAKALNTIKFLLDKPKSKKVKS